MGNYSSYGKELKGRGEARKAWKSLYDFFNKIGVTEAGDYSEGKLGSHAVRHRFLIMNNGILYRVGYNFKDQRDDWSSSNLELNVEFVGEDIPEEILDITKKLKLEKQEARMF